MCVHCLRSRSGLVRRSGPTADRLRASQVCTQQLHLLAQDILATGHLVLEPDVEKNTIIPRSSLQHGLRADGESAESVVPSGGYCKHRDSSYSCQCIAYMFKA